MKENIKKDYIKVGEQIIYLPDTDDNDWFSFCVDGIEVNTGHSIRILISDMRDYIKNNFENVDVFFNGKN
jgi:hypothetical protein